MWRAQVSDNVGSPDYPLTITWHHGQSRGKTTSRCWSESIMIVWSLYLWEFSWRPKAGVLALTRRMTDQPHPFMSQSRRSPFVHETSGGVFSPTPCRIPWVTSQALRSHRSSFSRPTKSWINPTELATLGPRDEQKWEPETQKNGNANCSVNFWGKQNGFLPN